MKNLRFYTIVLAGVLILLVFGANRKGSDPQIENIDFLRNGGIPQVIESIALDKSYEFAGEKLPMDNFDVRERLDREMTVNAYWHSSTLLNIKNANKYYPIVEPILREHNVPDDFKYLAVAESSLRNVTSPAGAKGIWQFMKPTAKFYGLVVESEVDERYHLEKSTVAFCKFIKDLKGRFGSWTLAAAAYNMGETRLSKELELQRSRSYYDLNLSEETVRYVFRIVALKEIIQDPRSFGFYIDDNYLYQSLTDYATVEVDGPVENWGDFANKYGTSYRLLKVYNPWMRSHKLTNREKKKYQIKIPKK